MLSLRLLQIKICFPWTVATLPYSVSRLAMEKPVEHSIRSKLTESLNPSHLEVHNESHMHAVPKDSETHFKVVVVSDSFSGKSLIQRHRLVNELLKEELAGSVHACPSMPRPLNNGKKTQHKQKPGLHGGLKA
ncbi:hypothetical protein GDO86_016520 [Hymenochirus boettgeri]|uniref:Uncharacterized protein n=1 Tax=Hymenochirus boettgeri TaxID=247094 RepID=A0A8T2JXA7_9PIPI|nr:hypothetical protein GDO86_016520 [Hymenochirus boettgeri]